MAGCERCWRVTDPKTASPVTDRRRRIERAYVVLASAREVTFGEALRSIAGLAHRRASEMPESDQPGYDEEAGDLRPIAAPLGVLIVAAAHRSRMRLPVPPRLAKVGRELSGEAFRPLLVWQNPADLR